VQEEPRQGVRAEDCGPNCGDPTHHAEGDHRLVLLF
jgi:hypothetical protein